MIFYGKRILFIGAHPDDIEIGAGAFLHHIGKRSNVLCVTLSDNQKNPLLQSILTEHYASMEVLGIPKENILVEKFTTRKFPEARQDILEYMLKLRREFNPDIIFVHSKHDLHQDHNVVADEALRAYRGITVLGFDVIRSSNGFFPDFLVEVHEEDVQKKVDALARYKTYADKYYFNPELLRSINIRHGSLAECQFAEGFDILRIVGRFEPCG